MKYMTKRVTGIGKIPKYNVLPPLKINDTEFFFKQLELLGFTLEDVDLKENSSEDENEKKNEESKVEEIENSVDKIEESTLDKKSEDEKSDISDLKENSSEDENEKKNETPRRNSRRTSRTSNK